MSTESKPDMGGIDWIGEDGEADVEAAKRWAREQSGKPYPGWPMKLRGPDGEFCGCELWPTGGMAGAITSLADHTLFGNCPNRKEQP